MLSITLLLTITSGCVTTRKSSITIPPVPVREELQEVHSVRNMADMVVYYEYLLREWEKWGETVNRIVEKHNEE